MRISLLLQREPFGEILCRTLERFLGDLDGRSYSVRWHYRRPLFDLRARKEAQRWLCNSYLNAIFLPRPSRSDLEPLIREFSRSLSLLRRLPQRAYVALATHPRGALLAADAFLDVSPAVSGAQHWIILGGNHKLRILDRPSGTATAILKAGCDPRRVRTEISVRRLAEQAGLPVPPLTRVAPDESWFTERYVTGTPLNRLEAREEAARAVKRVGASLARFSLDSREESSVADHVAPLLAQARRNAAGSKLAEGLRGRAERCLWSLERRLAEHARSQVATGLAHGDFQPANILSQGDTVWLIDWEFARRRQLGDDGLVYALGVRHPAGLADRLRRFVEQAPGDPLLKDWPGAEWVERAGRERAALVLMLEELALLLEEDNNPSLFAGSRATGLLADEIERWLRPA